MPVRPARPLVALGFAVVLLLAGCSDDEGADPVAQPSASSATPSDEASAGPSAAPVDGDAEPYPVAASGRPSPLPDLGTREGSRFTLTLNAVRRTSPQAVVVEATLSAPTNTPLTGLAESGYEFRRGTGEQRTRSLEFSAVTLSVPGDPLVYQPLRDEQGFCACTQGILSLEGGESMGVYTYVTAPEDADAVTVTVAGWSPFPDVPVSG